MRRRGVLLIVLLAVTRSPVAFAVDQSQVKQPDSAETAVIDPDASPPLSFQITPQLFMGARLGFSIETENNEDLDRSVEDGEIDVESDLSLATMIRPLADVELFGEIGLSYDKSFEERGDRESRTDIELKRGHILWRGFLVPEMELQVGRQRFKDRREWFFDENLDAIRIEHKGDPFELEFSASTVLIDPEDPEDETRNHILSASYQIGRKDKISLYGILRRDQTTKNHDPSFLGISWEGDLMKFQRWELESWLQGALLSGHEGVKKLRGYGVDVGGTSEFHYWMEPSFTAGFAFGSGDPDPTDNEDRNFQQTGLQDNSAKFNGTTRFKYYGEAFDPELSNMMIWTAGLGIIPLDSAALKASLDIVYHYYSQVERANKLRDAGVDTRPSGKERELGHEIDLIFGVKAAGKTQIELTAGVFVPGKAFPDSGSHFFSGELKFRLAF